MNDARKGLWPSLLKRLKSKLLGIAPVIAGSLALTLLLSIVLWAASPVLPPAFHELLQNLENGDWEASQESLSRIFDSLGVGKPIAFLLVQVLQVLFAPIPGQAVGLLGGVLFGFWQGLLLSMAGLAIGSTLAIGIGRLLGGRVVRRLVSPKALEKFDYLISEGGLWNFFLLFLLPALPDDAICFIAGLTRIPIWKLVLACVVGRLPGTAVLVYVASSVGENMGFANVVLAVAIVAAIGIWLYSDELEERLARWAKGMHGGRGGAK